MGRGLFYVSDYLLIVGGGRVAFGSISELDKQLDQYIGKQSQSSLIVDLYNTPK